MEPNEQIAQIKANSNKFTTTSIRGVQGGFVVAGQTTYQDKATKGIVFTENAEGVAANASDACTMSLNYHNTSAFDGAQTQASLFGNTGAPSAI